MLISAKLQLNLLYVFQFIWMIVTGYKGNAWYAVDLLYIRGYVLEAIVNADSLNSAKKYYGDNI